MHRKFVSGLFVATVVLCVVRVVGYGQDTSPVTPREEGAGPIVLTEATPLTAQEAADYARRQETAAQKQLLDSSVASISDSEIVTTYLLTAVLIAGVTLGTIFLAMG